MESLINYYCTKVIIRTYLCQAKPLFSFIEKLKLKSVLIPLYLKFT